MDYYEQHWTGRCRSFFASQPLLSSVIAFLLGSLMTLSYAPYGQWYLPFILLPTLLLIIQSRPSPKLAAQSGFWFGLGWFGTGVSWVHIAIADFGGLPLVLSVLMMLALAAYLALFPALFAWAYQKFNHKVGIITAPLLWLITEWLRSWFLTGFPWLSIGYSQTDSIFADLAPLIGEFGLQAVILFLSAVFIQHNKRHFALGALIIAGALGLQQYNWFVKNERDVTISLVQGNIEQSIRWIPENELPTMYKYLEMSEDLFGSSDIIIWPEAAIPRLEIAGYEYLRHLDMIAAQNNSAVISGIVDYQPDTSLAFNNIIALGKKQPEDEFGHYKYGHSNRYSKHHLLPIGEFVPFESVLRALAPIFNLPMSSFNRGSWQQDNLTANGVNFSPAICFEIAFPEQLRANLYQDSDLILTVSNDAWFGDSHGPWQHLQIAQMRAIEFAKPVIRVTNNGVTAIINEFGEISAMLEQNKSEVLTETLQLSSAKTPYQAYGRWLTLLFILVILLVDKTFRAERRWYK